MNPRNDELTFGVLKSMFKVDCVKMGQYRNSVIELDRGLKTVTRP